MPSPSLPLLFPNFLIIGATKAGTTSLHHYLDQHPEVFMCKRKETNFFAQDSATCFLGDATKTKEEYEKEFATVQNEKAIGETSPAYLAVPTTPEKIHELIPGAKIIAILRDPAERAYSHFLMRRRQGMEFRDSFEQCISEDDIDPERSYKSRGMYGEQLERYYRIFPKEQIKVVLYEDFCSDPRSVIQGIFKFLGVDPEFEPNLSERFNVNPEVKPLPSGLRKKLIDFYREDILKLQGLIDRDLSAWLAVKSSSSAKEYRDSRKKSVAKALSWRVIATLVTMIVTFIITGRIDFALEIGFLDTIIKLVAYYWHERAWERSR